ncbi:hypothetical protein COOONC_00787 [Cooperia oncophora]
MMMIVFPLMLIIQLSHQQTYIENPYYPPHGCLNYGYGDEYYYVCASSDCVCNNGTSGTSCSVVEDQCATLDPCPSVGGSHYTCTPGVGSYKCECASGYTGENCDESEISWFSPFS